MTATDQRRCQKCLKNVRVYMSCFKCDLIFHPNCFKRVPHVYVNEEGQAFCCLNITSNRGCSEEDVHGRPEFLEQSIKGENEGNNRDFELVQIDEKQADSKFKCKESSFDFNKKRRLRKNYQDCSSVIRRGRKGRPLQPKGNFKCEYCSFSASFKSNLVRHVRIHTKEKPFKCTYKNCKCTPVEKESCKCETCEYATGQRETLNAHLFREHNQMTRQYKCGYCKYVTHHRSSVVRHISMHTNSFKCNICEYATPHKSALDVHVLNQHSGKAEKYKCDHCEFVTFWRGNLSRHVRIHNN